MYEEAKQRFPVGCRVRGIVTQHCPFGTFVDLGDPEIVGLVEIVNFLDRGRMTSEQYPPVGTSIEAVVLDYIGRERVQVRMSMRPSQLSDTTLRARLLRLAGTVDDLPVDMGKNHDHHIDGAPKK